MMVDIVLENTIFVLPQKAQELVTEWLSQHSEELQNMWDKQEIKKLPPL